MAVPAGTPVVRDWMRGTDDQAWVTTTPRGQLHGCGSADWCGDGGHGTVRGPRGVSRGDAFPPPRRALPDARGTPGRGDPDIARSSSSFTPRQTMSLRLHIPRAFSSPVSRPLVEAWSVVTGRAVSGVGVSPQGVRRTVADVHRFSRLRTRCRGSGAGGPRQPPPAARATRRPRRPSLRSRDRCSATTCGGEPPGVRTPASAADPAQAAPSRAAHVVAVPRAPRGFETRCARNLHHWSGARFATCGCLPRLVSAPNRRGEGPAA